MKRYFRVHLKGAQSICFDVPANEMGLGNYVSIIQAAGCICTENFFISFESIKFIGVMQVNEGQELSNPYSKPTLVQ